RDPQLEEAIFGLAPGGISSPLKIPDGYAVVKVLQSTPSGVPPLAEIKELVLSAMKRDKAGQLATDRAKALVTEVGQNGDFMAVARKDGFATGETPLFSRAEPPKDRGGLPGAVLLAALQTPPGRLSEPVRTPSAVYVVKTLERESPDMKGFDAEKS